MWYVGWVLTDVASDTCYSANPKKLYSVLKALIKGLDIQKFWMCAASSVMQWGTCCKRKKLKWKKPLREPRMERAACCHSELPLFEMQRREAQGCCWKHPALGEQSLTGPGSFGAFELLILGPFWHTLLSVFWTAVVFVKSRLHDPFHNKIKFSNWIVNSSKTGIKENLPSTNRVKFCARTLHSWLMNPYWVFSFHVFLFRDNGFQLHSFTKQKTKYSRCVFFI